MLCDSRANIASSDWKADLYALASSESEYSPTAMAHARRTTRLPDAMNIAPRIAENGNAGLWSGSSKHQCSSSDFAPFTEYTLCSGPPVRRRLMLPLFPLFFGLSQLDFEDIRNQFSSCFLHVLLVLARKVELDKQSDCVFSPVPLGIF